MRFWSMGLAMASALALLAGLVGRGAAQDDAAPPRPAPVGRQILLPDGGIFAAPGKAGPAPAATIESVLGPLATSVTLGRSGAWDVSFENGRLVLTDAAQEGAVQLYTTPWSGDAGTGRSASVKVEMTASGPLRGAGLVVRVTPEDPRSRWLAWAVTPDRKAVLYRRTATSLDVLTSVELPGTAPPGGDVLQVDAKNGTLTFLADGQDAATRPPDGGPAASTVGILALGVGRYAFRDLQLAAPGSASAATAGKDGGGQPREGQAAAASLENTILDTDMAGAVLGIGVHELGHFMIGELQIPATGPEEDVADEFAAMTFIDNMKDTATRDFMIPAALGSAKLWWFMSEDRTDSQPPWYDEHAPDRARFGRLMCMLYGAEPGVFQSAVDEAGIPQRIQKRCLNDEIRRHAAWVTLLRSHRRRDISPLIPGDLDPKTPGHTVRLFYGTTKIDSIRDFAARLKSSQLFDKIADGLARLYVLPRDTRIVFRDCGSENSFYDPFNGSVTMCYELMAFALDTLRRHRSETRFGESSRPGRGVSQGAGPASRTGAFGSP
ncbi:MAG: hypothetical protein INR70_30585 [Parafilimonas terrae]|nr:hypothetical protein [Parafilimonas terrae]